MRRKITAFLGITLLILVISALSTSTAFAKGATPYEADVMAGADKVGNATLIVTKRTFAVNVHTTGLIAGHVYSVWGVIELSDLEKLKPNLAGRIAGGDGSLSFGGALSVDPSLDVKSFTVVIKDHGLPIPGLVDEQKSTKHAACDGSCPSVQKAFFDLS